MRHQLAAWTIALITLAFSPARALADEHKTTTAEPTAEVRRLFEALSEDDWKAREAARDQLIERGDEVLPQVRKLAEGSQDPEVRASVAAIEAGIEAGAIDRPSLITLDLTDAPAQDVLREIIRQAHAEIPIWPENAWEHPPLREAKVTVNVKRQPFWAVMREVLNKIPARVAVPGTHNLTLMQGKADLQGPAHFHGPFM